MSEIIKDLWISLKSLNGDQWIILVALSFLIGYSLFLIFQWIYDARIKSQDSLIELKDKTIEHYKNIHINDTKPKSLTEIIPDNWIPFLSQPYQQLEELLGDTLNQQTMNYTSTNMGFILDAELYILYLKLYYSYPSDKAKEFKEEQQNWLKIRREFCESSIESHGGSLASLEYNMAFIQQTNERIDLFKQQMLNKT